MTAESIYFIYTFTFDNCQVLKFNIRLDARTLKLLNNELQTEPDWARLENKQCSNCTLNSSDYPFCPIALNLVEILAAFRDVNSHEKVFVQVETRERTYSARVNVQNGLSSLLGIYMVTSGCPIMAVLRPMVRYHLPFATVEETIFRSVSTYLVGQYFSHVNKKEADWLLTGLKKRYEDVQVVNSSMADRLRSISEKDANVNALYILDIFAQQLPFSIDDQLKKIHFLFK